MLSVGGMWNEVLSVWSGGSVSQVFRKDGRMLEEGGLGDGVCEGREILVSTKLMMNGAVDYICDFICHTELN